MFYSVLYRIAILETYQDTFYMLKHKAEARTSRMVHAGGVKPQ